MWLPYVIPLCFRYRAHSSSVFELLLEVCPSLLCVPDTSGAVPYHLLQSRADLYQDLLVTCVRLSLAVDPTTGRPTDPAAHQFCWHHYLAHFSVGVEALLDEFQPRVLELAEQLDANGRRAVDVASLRNRQLIMKRIYLPVYIQHQTRASRTYVGHVYTLFRRACDRTRLS